ncbi:MAG TPA: sulfate adenylyltransferase subunit CysN, partial [Protaetiibacter sp.]|nr:sulfate adenylyltransferase subunit CysN [Protaetiibacter sp.]
MSARESTLLRICTAGSVDDGKSTLIGRLLYESKMVFDDHLAALESDSKKFGTQGGELDFALLVDGLSAEREQGITIDVAYRFFSTDARKFIVADTPGHEQYTRNMVTGASTADVAVILVDARKGVLTQTRRHSFLVSLIGIRKVAVAINKADLVGYDQDTIRAIEDDYRSFAAEIGLSDITVIPLSALAGDNVITRSENTPWYEGPTLMEYLDSVEVDRDAATNGPFRMPVQWVNRPDLDFRGFSGQVMRGTVSTGQRVTVLPSGQSSTVTRILGPAGELREASAGQPVTLTLSDEIDISRGDVLCAAEEPAQVGDQFEANLVWMSEEPMLPERQYLLKTGTKVVGAVVTRIKHKINVNTLEHISGTTLELNDIAVCNIALDLSVAFDPYVESRDMGGFILIDRITGNTVGAGMIHFALRRSTNVQWQSIEVTKAARSEIKGQQPCVVWFTGLSGAGKSTIGNLLEKRLHAMGRHTVLLDGDNVRHGLNRDLGFTDADRVENIRRIAEVSALMVDAGLVVLVSFISPFREERQMARDLVQPGEFCEVFVDTPLQVAEQRDVLAHAFGRLARALDAPDVVIRLAVREVHAQHVGAAADHFLEHARCVGGRAER